LITDQDARATQPASNADQAVCGKIVSAPAAIATP
jgi:hypothetical protein